jgi:hypothetical protein
MSYSMPDFTKMFGHINERTRSAANVWGNTSGNVGGNSNTETVSSPSGSNSKAGFSAMGTDHSSLGHFGTSVNSFSRQPIDPSASLGGITANGADKFAFTGTSEAWGKPGIIAGNKSNLDFMTGPGGSSNFNMSSTSGNWI